MSDDNFNPFEDKEPVTKKKATKKSEPTAEQLDVTVEALDEGTIDVGPSTVVEDDWQVKYEKATELIDKQEQELEKLNALVTDLKKAAVAKKNATKVSKEVVDAEEQNPSAYLAVKTIQAGEGVVSTFPKNGQVLLSLSVKGWVGPENFIIMGTRENAHLLINALQEILDAEV